jgi:hypothetical protein
MYEEADDDNQHNDKYVRIPHYILYKIVYIYVIEQYGVCMIVLLSALLTFTLLAISLNINNGINQKNNTSYHSIVCNYYIIMNQNFL